MATCDHCGANVEDEEWDLTYVPRRRQYWCQSCAARLVVCDRCSDPTDVVVDIDSDPWCPDCVGGHTIPCDECGEVCDEDLAHLLPDLGTWLCPACYGGLVSVGGRENEI